MRIKSVRVVNYKGFDDSGVVELGAGWTVIVGRNNAGKSALLEALSFASFQDKPHLHISRHPLDQPNPISELYASVLATPKELERAFLRHDHSIIYLPFPGPLEAYFADTFLARQYLEFTIRKTGGNVWQPERYPSHGLFKSDGPNFAAELVPNRERRAWSLRQVARSDGDSVTKLLDNILTTSCYVFKAERRVNGASPLQNDVTLNPDASNLPGALHYLRNSNDRQFDDFLALVREVLPEVEAITVPPEGGQPRIKVWMSGRVEGRADLAIPLEECGTGIGQVLAILFVVVTAESGRLIVIDEPNSFLHPGASRTLMQILRRYQEHQYVISTHSADLIGATNPDKLILVRWDRGRSFVTSSDGKEIGGVRMAFDELGVRLSDVFGYDAIVWVEGKTEERCFPLVLAATGVELPARTAFVSIVNTGDFDGADAETIWKVYQRLSTQSSLAPQTISISLDMEKRSPELLSDLAKRSGGLLRFLPRRSYENYLLHAEAIAAVLHSVDPEGSADPADVQGWIDLNRSNKRYFKGMRDGAADDNWPKTIDAPRLLKDLVAALSSNRYDYASHKVEFGVALTKWLIEGDVGLLSDIGTYVASLLTEQ